MKKILVSTMAVMTIFSFSASGVFASICPDGQKEIVVKKEVNVGFDPVKYGLCMITVKKGHICRAVAATNKTKEYVDCMAEGNLI